MMSRAVLVVVLLLLGGLGDAVAQSDADAYFHEAAQAYVDNDLPTARRAVAQGLEAAPSDPRLQALRDKLQQSRPEEGDPDRASDAERPPSSENESEASGTDGQSQSEAGDRSRDAPGAEEPERPDGQGAPSGADPQAEARPPEGEAEADGGGAQADEPRPTRQLGRAQAEQLLRALEVQEEELLRTLQLRDGERRSVEKDW
ncbi:MAG: hypothetical protein R6T83_11970 [Salinibacter sp.]